MKNKRHVLISATMLLALLLGACSLAPATSTEDPANEKLMLVGPELVDCTGEGPQKCMLVKENPEADYQLFYDQIEGFDYEEGYEYVLAVRQEPIENPPAGGSSIRWILVEEIDKAPFRQGGETPPDAIDVDETTRSSLEVGAWRLISYVNLKGTPVDVIPGSEISAEFNGSQLNGNAGCNTYFGSYQTDGEGLSISDIGMTEMYCTAPKGIMEQETEYLAALGNAASYQISDERLMILDSNGATILTYTMIKPTPLTNTTWELLSYNNGQQAMVSTMAGSQITAAFGDDGALTGSAGCNNYNTSYEVNGSAIQIGPAAVTLMFCADPEGVMDQENAYLAALEAAVAYQIEGETLKMADENGELVLSFHAATGAKLVPESIPVPLLEASPLTPEAVTFNSQGLAESVGGETIPASAYDASQPPVPTGAPEHVVFSFDGEQRLFVFPIAEYQALWEAESDTTITQQVNQLSLLLGQQPQAPEPPMPILPPPGGVNDLAAGGRYLDFASGSGVRFVGRVSQDASPVLNNQLNYYFQGMSEDGLYYVSLVYPINSAALPDEASQLTPEQQELLGNDFAAYMTTTQDALNALTSSDFTPDLAKLDAMVESITIQAVEASAEAPVLTGVIWQWQQFQSMNDDLTVVDEPAKYTLEFLNDGTVRIQADCNVGSGVYAAEGGSLTIEINLMTMAACSADSLADEYVQLLQDVVSYLMEDGNLNLALKMDAGIMQFSP